VNTIAASNFRNEYSVKRLVSTETKGSLTSLTMDGIGLLVVVLAAQRKKAEVIPAAASGVVAGFLYTAFASIMMN
jgi:hypothetical protein